MEPLKKTNVNKTAPEPVGEVVTGAPMFPDSGNTGASRFVFRGWNDVWAIFAFLFMLIALVVVSGVWSGTQRGAFWTHMTPEDTHSMARIVAVLPVVLAAAVIICLASIVSMTHYPLGYIKTVLISIIVINFCLAAWLLANHRYLGGILFLIMAILTILFYVLSRHLMDFSAVLLKVAGRITTNYVGIFGTLLVAVASLIAFLAIWTFAAAPALSDAAAASGRHRTGPNNRSLGAVTTLVLIFSAFALFWVVQVITNVVHVTVGGVTAIWYFVGESAMPVNPTSASAKRAMTCSFGSICFGSLLVAIIQTLIYIVKLGAGDGNDFSRCIAECILQCLEELLEKFNVYAFTHVAIYGTSYVDAAVQTYHMVKNFGWAAYFNDALVWPCITITTFVATIIVGLAVHHIEQDAIVTIFSDIFFYTVMLILLRPIYASVVTQFVCVAEAQDSMRTANPAYAAELVASMPIQHLA